MSIELKNTKEKSLQPFLLSSSIMNLKKDYKNNRKSDSHKLNPDSENGAASIF
jgi:hypothetical protein